jgi:integrase
MRSAPVPRKPFVPSLRRHKPSGQGVVTLSGKDVYCGAWPAALAEAPAEVRARYDAAVASWLAAGRTRHLPSTPAPSTSEAPDRLSTTVAELALAFIRHAEAYYARPDGAPTGEVGEYARTLGLVNRLFGELPAASFGPLRLLALREHMVGLGWSRGVINQRVRRVVRCFKWGASREMVGPLVYQALRTVPGLSNGRSAARETQPVLPVEEAVLAKVIGTAPPVVACALRLMRWTGCRPGEALALRMADVDRAGETRAYRPGQHKTAWRGKSRVVVLGPNARRALCDALALWGEPPSPEAFVFSPALARRLRYAAMRAARKSRAQPSQQDRSKRSPKKAPGARYTVESFNAAVARACDAAGVERFHPNRVRHLFATLVRRRFGLEGAQVTLGHCQANVTEIYAERDGELARRVAREVG